MPEIRVATTQFAARGDDLQANIATAEAVVRAAASDGARLILLQELFCGRYFCQEQVATHFERALPAASKLNPVLQHFSALAKELAVALPIFFRKYGSIYLWFAMNDTMVKFTACHSLPTTPRVRRKFYFSPGDSGFKVESICSRAARWSCYHWDRCSSRTAMTLAGADVILYPHYGSEPPGQISIRGTIGAASCKAMQAPTWCQSSLATV